MLAPTYKTLNELVDSINFPQKISPDWERNSAATKATADFYEQWSTYLSPIPQTFTYFLNLPGWIAKALYSINYALENVYNNLFKLFGFFDYLDSKETFIGQIFDGLQKLGVAVFVLLLIMFVCASFVTGLMRYKDVISHFLLVTAVLFLLPQAIKQFSSTLLGSQQTIRSLSDKGGDQTISSLSIQPFTSNVVDLYVVMQNNFNTDALGMDDRGFLNPAKTNNGKGDLKLNNIEDSTVMKTDFSAWYGGTDKEVLEQFNKDAEHNRNFRGVAALLSSVLKSKEEGNVWIDKVKAGTWSELENVFSSVYPRYSVNWIGLIAQQVILIALIITMSIKFVQSVYHVLVAGMIAPIVGYTSVESSEKFKELLMTIFGTITGLYFQVILLRVAMSMLRDFPNIVAEGLDGAGFTSNLNYWENIIASIIVYAGVYFAVSSGNNAVERWLGVSTSDNSGSRLAGMAGAGMAAGTAASRASSRMAKAAPTVARGTARGVKSATGKAGAAAQGVGRGTKAVGRGALKASGAVHGAIEGVQRAGGVGGAVSNVATRTSSSAKSAIQSTAQGVKDTVASAKDTAAGHYNTGRDAAVTALGTDGSSTGKGRAGTANSASGVGNTQTKSNQPQSTTGKQGIGGVSGSQIGKGNSSGGSSGPSNSPSKSSSDSNQGGGIHKKGGESGKI